jgi:hypothetical protein
MSQEHYPGMSGLVLEKIIGGPEPFGVCRVNDMPAYTGFGGNGAKPSGMICVDGKLYYAVQNLLGMKTPPHRPGSQHGSDATIICSADHGKTWIPDLDETLKGFAGEHYHMDYGKWETHWLTEERLRTDYRGWQPMFPGSAFGGPSFVQFGKNNADAVDGDVYAISSDQWDNGRIIRLGRVPKDRILDRTAWEFAALGSSEDPVWHSEIVDASPILDIEGHISLPEMVYIASIRKYLLLTWGLHKDFSISAGSELTVLEADYPWGPFALVHYDWMWDRRECCPYAPRVPLKWFDGETLTGYLLHSGGWGSPFYVPHVRRFKLSAC